MEHNFSIFEGQPATQFMKETTMGNVFEINHKTQKDNFEDEKFEERKARFLGNDLSDNKKRQFESDSKLRKKKREEVFKRKREANIIIFGGTFTPKYEKMGKEFASKYPIINDMNELKGMLQSGIEEKMYLGAINLRNMLTMVRIPEQTSILDLDFSFVLLDILKLDSLPHIQFEAAWCLINIIKFSYNVALRLSMKGGLERFIHLFQSPDPELTDLALWAIGNLAGDLMSRDNLVEEEFMRIFFPYIIRLEQKEYLNTALWCLGNICRNLPLIYFTKIRDGLEVLPVLLNKYSGEEVIVERCIECLMIYLKLNFNQTMLTLHDNLPTCQIIANCLNSCHPRLLRSALNLLGFMSAGNVADTQLVMQCGVLVHMTQLLHRKDNELLKEAVWLVSNLTAGDHIQRNLCFQAGIMAPLVDILNTTAFHVRIEAVWALSNSASTCDIVQAMILLEVGMIEAIVNFLTLNTLNPRIICVALAGLYHLLKNSLDLTLIGDINPVAVRLEECGGLEVLEKLQEHANVHVYEQVVKILETFFSGDDNTPLACITPTEQPPQVSIFDY